MRRACLLHGRQAQFNLNKMHRIRSVKKKAKKKQTKKRKSQQKYFSWKRFMFGMLCILFLIIIIYTLFFSKLATIKEINVYNNQIIDSGSIVQKAESQMSAKNFLQVARNNFFLVSESYLQQIILENFPKIKSVEVKRVFPNQINISIVEHSLIPVVCIESREGECFILEDDGRIVEKADFNSAKLKENEIVVIIDKNKNDIVEFGKEFILEKKLNNIIFLGEELTYALNTKIQQPYIIPARGADEVKFNTSEGWYLQVDTADNPKVTLKVLDLFFKKGLKDDIRRYDLEYVDTRTNEKIFYKYKKGRRVIENSKDDESESGVDEVKNKTDKEN